MSRDSFESWVPRSRGHLPDGYIKIVNSQGQQLVYALEVELTIKTRKRYEPHIVFYDQQFKNKNLKRVLWITKSKSHSANLHKIISEKSNSRSPDFHLFASLSDLRPSNKSQIITHGRESGNSVAALAGVRTLCGQVRTQDLLRLETVSYTHLTLPTKA